MGSCAAGCKHTPPGGRHTHRKSAMRADIRDHQLKKKGIPTESKCLSLNDADDGPYSADATLLGGV
jgi:hypothetical protein